MTDEGSKEHLFPIAAVQKSEIAWNTSDWHILRIGRSFLAHFALSTKSAEACSLIRSSNAIRSVDQTCAFRSRLGDRAPDMCINYYDSDCSRWAGVMLWHARQLLWFFLFEVNWGHALTWAWNFTILFLLGLISGYCSSFFTYGFCVRTAALSHWDPFSRIYLVLWWGTVWQTQAWHLRSLGFWYKFRRISDLRDHWVSGTTR